MALWKLRGNSDVRAASKRLGVIDERADEPLFSSFIVEPSASRAHLPDAVPGLTLDRILDSAASNFGMVVAYGTCPEAPLYAIYGVQVRDL